MSVPTPLRRARRVSNYAVNAQRSAKRIHHLGVGLPVGTSIPTVAALVKGIRLIKTADEVIVLSLATLDRLKPSRRTAECGAGLASTRS